MAAVNITNQQLQELIAAVTVRVAGGAGGAAGTISAAALVGTMGACTLGNDKLKRPENCVTSCAIFRDYRFFIPRHYSRLRTKMRLARMAADEQR